MDAGPSSKQNNYKANIAGKVSIELFNIIFPS